MPHSFSASNPPHAHHLADREPPPGGPAAWFLGPQAEQADVWKKMFDYIFADYIYWRRNYCPHDGVIIDRELRREQEPWLDALASRLDGLLNDLKGHYPFYSPRYLAHMLSEQTLPSVLGYFAGLLYNPNNVTDEAAPVTVHLEIEVGRIVAEMLGFNPTKSWTHLTSGGTIANLEALWVARSVQFAPLIVRDHCREHEIEFMVGPREGGRPITEAGDRELLSLRPDEAAFMIRKLIKHHVTDLKQDAAQVVASVNRSIDRSPHNIRKQGFARVLRRVGLDPKLFVSCAAHYSIRKAASVLGYGEDAIIPIPVDRAFRANVGELRRRLESLDDSNYVAAVIAIVGTTEEGAVDPVDRILLLRDDLYRERELSFWVHVDAAWGGYFRSLLRGIEFDRHPHDSFADIVERVRHAIDVKRDVPSPVGGKPSRVLWNSPDIIGSLIAMERVDSVTIDPHKMGYVPYPAGVVSFRNGLVREQVTQRAQYISEEGEHLAIDDPGEASQVGPYILEGSKPGFVAAGCWLSHKLIPLDRQGHGRLAAEVAISARTLYLYLVQHRRHFAYYEKLRRGDPSQATEIPEDTPLFTFYPLYYPDTNVVCFLARPCAMWAAAPGKHARLHPTACSLRALNDVNRKLYERLDIPRDLRGRVTAHHLPFVVSRTVLARDQYTYESLAECLAGAPLHADTDGEHHEEGLGIQAKDYNREGLFVLRSTIMNPMYGIAAERGKDYLREFVLHLHTTTIELLRTGAAWR